MAFINRLSTTFLIFTLLTITACVTINVYFPASQAERAAERIVDEILGPSSDADKKQPAMPKDAWNLDSNQSGYQFSFSRFLINDAVAAQPDFSVNTPEIKRLEASMGQRHRQLEGFYASGAIGFDKSGLVAMRDQNAVSLKERGQLNSLIKAENADRNQLYKAIANANGHPEWEAQVRDVFASKWAQKARSGWWYQTSSGAWKKK
jgi:uncharacterized protein YdbL (DUF1318 family)